MPSTHRALGAALCALCVIASAAGCASNARVARDYVHRRGDPTALVLLRVQARDASREVLAPPASEEGAPPARLVLLLEREEDGETFAAPFDGESHVGLKLEPGTYRVHSAREVALEGCEVLDRTALPHPLRFTVAPEQDIVYAGRLELTLGAVESGALSAMCAVLESEARDCYRDDVTRFKAHFEGVNWADFRVIHGVQRGGPCEP